MLTGNSDVMSLIVALYAIKVFPNALLCAAGD